MALWTPYNNNETVKNKSETNMNNSEWYSSDTSSNDTYQGFIRDYSQNSITVPTALSSPDSTSSSQSNSPSSVQNTLALPSTLIGATESLLNDEEYKAFEENAFMVMSARNGGSLLLCNPRMRRAVQQSNSDVDDGYHKQREKNNLAAKQSRDRRKLLEFRLEVQVKFLTQKVNEIKTMASAGVCIQCKRVCRRCM